MAELHILNRHDELLVTISEETGLLSALFREELNRVPDDPFIFTVDASSEHAEHVVEENQVVFRDKEGELRLYVIKEIDDEHSDNPQVIATCEPAFLELKEHIVVERRFVNQDAQRALDAALQGTRWQGTVELELGQATTNFYYISAVDAVWKVLNTWGGELKDVVTFDGNRIVKREIRILARRGIDSGKRFEIGHNVEEIKRTVLSYPVTALYGRGASLQNEDDDGNATGGHSRYIDFAEVEWKKNKGDPVDKPKGQKWVGSPQALQKYGRMHDDKLLHREAIWQNGDIEDPKVLLEKTWEQLQEVSRPEVNYQLSVRLLEHIAGYEHEKVSLGDIARAFDRNFSRPIEMQARVIAVEYDLLDVEGTATVEMGQFLTLPDANARIDKVEAELNDKRRQWDAGSDMTIDASKYPDIVPLVPVVTVKGLFAAIKVDWEYNYLDTYIAGYEVYVSEVKDFIPSPETMVWRGYGNSYSYHGEVNKQYYVRVRAFNYHSRYSDFSDESTATTQRVISREVLFGEEHAETLRELSERAQIIASNSLSGEALMNNSITEDHFEANALVAGLAAINKAIITDAHIENVIIKTAQIKDQAVTTSKIDELAVDNAQIAEGAITDGKISNLDAGKITSGFIDAANIAIMAKGSKDNDRQVIKMDKDGMHSYDSSGKLRILLGVTNYRDGNPAVLRFFDKKEKNMGYIGANIEDTLALYSAGHMHVETKEREYHLASEYRFSFHRDDQRAYWIMGSNESKSGDLNPSLKPNLNAYGLLGLPSQKIWESHIVHANETNIYYKNLKKDSLRGHKENIQDVDIDHYASVFDALNFVTYHYKDTDEEENPSTFVKKNIGLIFEDCPEEIKAESGILMDDLTALIGIKVQQQSERIATLETELEEMKRERKA